MGKIDEGCVFITRRNNEAQFWFVGGEAEYIMNLFKFVIYMI